MIRRAIARAVSALARIPGEGTMPIQPPAPPYLGPPAHTTAGQNKPIHRIVIHATVSECCVGARGIAAYFKNPKAGGSAHYVVDANEVIQSAYDSVIAWHAPPNQNSLGVEMCCTLANEGEGHWSKPDHRAMIRRTAALVAQLALAYDVPIRKLRVSDLKAGKHGICGHADVSQAFGQSTHWDPGPFFPWRYFMAQVRKAAKEMQATPAPAPKPAPKPKTATTAALTIATANVGNGTNDEVTADLLRLLEDADVLCVQECGDRGPVLDALEAKGYKTYRGDGRSGSAKDCVIWRPEMVTTGHEGTEGPVSPRAKNGKGAAGPKMLDQKFINWVDLKLAGRVLTVASTHVVPSVWQPSNRRLAAGHIRKAACWVETRQSLVFVGMDANMSPKSRLMQPMRDAGLTSDHDVLGRLATHGARTIDAIWTAKDDARVQVVKHEAVKTSSDHRAVVVTYAIQEKP